MYPIVDRQSIGHERNVGGYYGGVGALRHRLWPMFKEGIWPHDRSLLSLGDVDRYSSLDETKRVNAVCSTHVRASSF